MERMTGRNDAQAADDAPLLGVGLYARNFKSFGDLEQGLDRFERVTLLVGPNNCGKSALIDAIAYACKEGKQKIALRGRSTPEGIREAMILQKGQLSQPILDEVSKRLRARGKQLLPSLRSAEALVCVHDNRPDSYVKISGLTEEVENLLERVQFARVVAQQMPRYLSDYRLVRLRSDRDIRKERASESTAIAETGEGFTNVVRRLLHRRDMSAELVEDGILSHLNQILGPTSSFSRIVCLSTGPEGDGAEWEICLVPAEGGDPIPLSESGSGLKTIILVVGLLLFSGLPELGNAHRRTRFIFALEELENNLHPAVLRRLIRFVVRFVRMCGAHLVLSTHSSVEIDLLASMEDCQVVHVDRTEGCTRCRRVTTAIAVGDILDDLDIRASDLLQSNSVIWVEGPSDRIYMKAWIEAVDPRLIDGVHYLCVSYGGRLLAHLRAGESEATDAMDLLRVNRQTVVLMDSDRRKRGARLLESKRRVANEVKASGGVVWITKGREIENYLPPQVIQQAFGLTSEPPRIGLYEEFVAYLRRLRGVPKRDWSRGKIKLAELTRPHFDTASMTGHFDLLLRVTSICKAIRGWNSLPDSE